MRLRLIVGAVALATLTACSSGGGAPLTAGSAAPTTAASATGAAKPTMLNVYTGWNGQFTENFNPIAQGVTPIHGTMGMIYEPLMFFNQAKADDVQPLLATAYEFGDGGKSLTFTLREGVKWSDGTPFTAEDVAFNFTYRRDNADLKASFENLKDAQVVDPTHVKVTFDNPAYTDLWSMAGQWWMVPKSVFEKVEHPNKEINAKPVGTGPFMLDEFTPNSYTLKKNPTYWEPGKPKIEGMRFWTFNNNDAAVAALASGQIDWMGGFMPDIESQYVSKDPEHNKYKNESFLYVTNLVPNLTKAPMNDLAVRQAVSLALDREKIIDLAFAGTGKMPSPLQLALPVFQDYVSPKHASLQLEFSQDKARQTLEAAGYKKNGDGFYEKDGKELSITCHVVTGWSDYISTMQVVQQQLKEVGIKFKSKEVSFAAFTDVQQKGDFQMIIWNAWGGPNPYFMYHNIVDSKAIPPANQNMARWTNSTVDGLLKTIEATPPDQLETIKQAIYGIQDQIVAETPYIPIQQSASFAEFRTVNAIGWPSEENPYALTLPFSIPDNGIVAKNIEPAKP